MIVKSKVKEKAVVDGKQLNVAGDFADALEKQAEELVTKAAVRAHANGRSTVMAKDL
jgi:histone H3/H4